MSKLSQNSIDFETRLAINDRRLDTAHSEVKMLLDFTEK